MVWARVRIFLTLLFAWTAAAWAFGNTDPAKGEMLIRNDRGGQIGTYIKRFSDIRAKGEMVIINGDCLSACTLALGMIPKNHLCVTQRANLGFHAAWDPDGDGNPVTSKPGTEVLWNIYPLPVKRWIKRHGGLTRKMIYLKGKALAALYTRCKQVPSDALAQAHQPLQIMIYAHTGRWE